MRYIVQGYSGLSTMIDWQNLLVSEGVKALFGVLTLIVGATFAIYGFYSQKEYELVKQRYLEGSVDVIAAAFEEILGVVAHNYARTLVVLKFFREEGQDFNLAELDRGYREFDSSSFHEVAFFRLRILLGSSIYWDLFQSAKASSETVNGIMVPEVRHGVKMALKEGWIEKNDHRKFVNEFAEHCRDKFDSLSLHTRALHELNVIATVLGKQRLSFKHVERFRNQKDVVESMARIRDAYPDAATAETN